MEKKSYKKIVMLVIFLLLTFWVAFWNHEERDYYRQEISAVDMKPSQEIPPDQIGIDTGFFKKLIFKSPDGYQGVFATSAPIALEKGQYVVNLDYASSAAGSVLEVISPSAAGENNQKGLLLGRVELVAGGESAQLVLTLDKTYQDITLQVSYAGGELILKTTQIYSEGPHYSDSLFLWVLLVLAVSFWIIVQKYVTKKEEVVIIGLLCLTAVVATIPLFNDFLVQGQDLDFHLARIEGIYQALWSGQVPVRLNMVQGYGYGYASPILYPELFLYIPAVLRGMGVSLMLSYKVFLLLINLACVWIAYISFRRLLRSNRAGFITAVLYTLCSYRLINLYHRAALGEAIAMIFLPLIVYGVYEILFGEEKNWMFAVAGYVGLLQSHMISTQLVLLFSIGFGVVALPSLCRKKERWFSLAKAAGSSFLLSLWFILPFLDYQKLPLAVSETGRDLHQTATYFSQLFTTFVGDLGQGCLDLGKTQGEMPLSIGLPLTIGCILFWIMYVKQAKGDVLDKEKQRLLLLGKGSFIAGAIAIVLSSFVFPWETLQKVEAFNAIFSIMQFPYRMLLIASIFFTLTAGIGIWLLAQGQKAEDWSIVTKWSYVIFALSTLGIVYLLDGTTLMETYPDKDSLMGMQATDDMYQYVDTNAVAFVDRGDVLTFSAGAIANVSQFQKQGDRVTAFLEVNEAAEGSYVELPLTYYPGYQAFLEDEAVNKKIELAVARGENGVVRVEMPQESGNLCVAFQERRLWMVGNAVSILTIIGMTLVFVRSHRKQKGRN